MLGYPPIWWTPFKSHISLTSHRDHYQMGYHGSSVQKPTLQLQSQTVQVGVREKKIAFKQQLFYCESSNLFKYTVMFLLSLNWNKINLDNARQNSLFPPFKGTFKIHSVQVIDKTLTLIIISPSPKIRNKYVKKNQLFQSHLVFFLPLIGEWWRVSSPSKWAIQTRCEHLQPLEVL